MFLVFNKDKAISYVVTVFTVVVLFLAASVFKNKEESIQTSTNEIVINRMENIEINEIKGNNIEDDNLIEHNKILNNY